MHEITVVNFLTLWKKVSCIFFKMKMPSAIKLPIKATHCKNITLYCLLLFLETYVVMHFDFAQVYRGYHVYTESYFLEVSFILGYIPEQACHT